MKLINLLEVKNLNSKKREELLDSLRNINEPNMFVSFTNIPKLGINPHSPYDETPLGIYGYPLNYFIEKDGDVPYGSELPYMWLFRGQGNILVLDEYGKEDYNNDLEKLKKIFKNDPNTLKNAIEENTGFPYPILIWNIIKKLTDSPIQWNMLFRELGYSGVVDNGQSIIFEAEPCQAVFFSIKSVKVVKLFNTTQRDNVSRKNYDDYIKYSINGLVKLIQSGHKVSTENIISAILHHGIVIIEILLSMSYPISRQILNGVLAQKPEMLLSILIYYPVPPDIIKQYMDTPYKIAIIRELSNWLRYGKRNNIKLPYHYRDEYAKLIGLKID